MTVERVFAIWDWPTVFGLVVLGLVIGYALIPVMWPLRGMEIAYPVLVSGLPWITIGGAFFLFEWVFRELNGVLFAERTLATGLQWIIFASSLTVGLKVRNGWTK